MSFVLAPHESPGEGLSRVIREQVHKLSAECAEAGQEQAAFAHKARVRCKRVRAALRLAKPLMGAKAYRRENRWWRDQARLLSELRDAGARIEALDTLRPFLASRIGSDATRRLEERFLRSRRNGHGLRSDAGHGRVLRHRVAHRGLHQRRGERARIRHQGACRGEAEAHGPVIAEHGDVEPQAVLDDGQRPIRRHAGAHRVQRGGRAGHIGDHHVGKGRDMVGKT